MTVCFTAIVKQEAHVIRRCINSCLGQIDSYSVVDTGSTDGTQDIIREHFKEKGIPGHLYQREWEGFGASRTKAIRLAESRADFLLMMDADHTLEGTLPPLNADAYLIEHRYATLAYGLPILMRSNRGWRYEMPVHEMLTSDEHRRVERAEGCWIDVHPDGHRSSGDPVAKYKGDVEVLEKWTKENPTHARGWYYLAQSMRDVMRQLLVDEANRDEAIRWAVRSKEAYLHRATLAGFIEETWSALYEAGKIAAQFQHHDAAAIFLRAFNYRPTRAEPLWALARYHRLSGEHALAYVYSRRAAEMKRPGDILFVEHDVYSWAAKDELAIAAWMIEEKDIGREAMQGFHTSVVPPSERERIAKNRMWYGL